MVIKTELQGNNLDLRTILNMVNNLPNKGSGGKIFAAIGVTYPEGSTCTCTNGTKTMEAGNTNGQWVFAIPKAGTWTVTATNGTNTKSQSVSITTEGQWESVELSYALVLFDGGDNTDVTGGWSSDRSDTTVLAGSTVGMNVDGATTSAGQSKAFLVATKNVIDLSSYSKLCVTIEEVDLGSAGGSATARVVPNIDSSATAKASATASVGTVEVDISSLENGHIALHMVITSNPYAYCVGSISASKIWLE